MAALSKVRLADLQEQARRLGVSDKGTKAQIAARIAQKPSRLLQCDYCDFATWQRNVLRAHARQQHRKEI